MSPSRTGPGTFRRPGAPGRRVPRPRGSSAENRGDLLRRPRVKRPNGIAECCGRFAETGSPREGRAERDTKCRLAEVPQRALHVADQRAAAELRVRVGHEHHAHLEVTEAARPLPPTVSNTKRRRKPKKTARKLTSKVSKLEATR